MKSIQVYLEAPSKTFLIGEYGVLDGGPAIILNTKPQFSLKAVSSDENQCRGIHPLSPAGKWIRLRSVFLNKLDIEFNDPWNQSGGLGASSAQFLFVHALSEIVQGRFNFVFQEDYLGDLLRDFRDLYEDTKGVLPSGADVVSQFMGRVTLIRDDRKKSESVNWPFAFKNFLIFKTNNKVTSHEHLQSVRAGDLKEFKNLANKSVFFFENEQWNAFVESLKDYHRLLVKYDWVHPSTLKLVETLSTWMGVDAVKGCGALGADTIVVICDDTLSLSLIDRAKSLDLTFVGDKTQLSQGLTIQYQRGQDIEKEALKFVSGSDQRPSGVTL